VQLIWDGKLDSGSGAAALVADFRSHPVPEGLSISSDRTFVEGSTRSIWALATWAVSAVMIWFGLTSDNWFLLVLAPFMVGAAVMQTLGTVRILIRDQQVTLFEGVGGIGLRRRMPLDSIQSVEYAVKRGRGGATAWIAIHQGKRALKFGRHLTDEQRQFVIAFLLDAARSI
jgi:hypothetical protein